MKKKLYYLLTVIMIVTNLYLISGCSEKTDAVKLQGRWYLMDEEQVTNKSIEFKKVDDKEKISGDYIIYNDDGDEKDAGRYVVDEKTQQVELYRDCYSSDDGVIFPDYTYHYEIEGNTLILDKMTFSKK